MTRYIVTLEIETPHYPAHAELIGADVANAVHATYGDTVFRVMEHKTEVAE